MVEIDSFDKSMFNIYVDSILKLMATKGCLDLSERISGLIGNPEYDVNNRGWDYAVRENSFNGFFNREAHGVLFHDGTRPAALEKLKNYLKLDPMLEQKEIEEFVNSYTSNDYNQKLTIYRKKNSKGSVESNVNGIISENTYEKIICRVCSAQKSLTLNNEITIGKEGILCLPDFIFKKRQSFFSYLFQEIFTHLICNHKTETCSKKVTNITLQSSNIGVKSECFYLFDIQVQPVQPWLSENGLLKFPDGLKREFENSGLIRYCDYLIITPHGENEKYHVLNVANKRNTKFDAVNNEIYIHVRFNKILKVAEENGEGITLSNQYDSQSFFKIDNKKINHILLFNQHRTF